MPRMERKTVRFSRAKPMMRRVSRSGLQSRRRSAAGAGAGGTPRLASQPAPARASTVAETVASPPIFTSAPPSIVPSRMAAKVPICTRALPPTSSSAWRCCGRMLYLTGPKTAECVPIRKTTPSSRGTLWRWRPAAPSSMIPISNSFTSRMIRALSNLSAICPALAEKRKKGSVSRPVLRLTSVFSENTAPPIRNANRMTSAFLNRLSLRAPRNWVQKKGPNHLALSSSSWPIRSLASSPVDRPILRRAGGRSHATPGMSFNQALGRPAPSLAHLAFGHPLTIRCPVRVHGLHERGGSGAGGGALPPGVRESLPPRAHRGRARGPRVRVRPRRPGMERARRPHGAEPQHRPAGRAGGRPRRDASRAPRRRRRARRIGSRAVRGRRPLPPLHPLRERPVRPRRAARRRERYRPAGPVLREVPCRLPALPRPARRAVARPAGARPPVREPLPGPARLRAAVWQSIFTHDMRRYRRALYERMDDVTTLVVGPSGTGKEVVARAIGLSRYIPFEARAQRFAAHFGDLFHPLNLSALSPTLIAPPPLAEQLRESPDELPNLILFLARRLVGDEEADALADEVRAWIEEHLGPTYPWPGNVRELEQCVRNVLIRGEYRPPTVCDGHPEGQLAAALRAGELTADQLLARYCALVYAETRSYQETARRLGLDRRTVDQYKAEGK